MVHDNGIMIIKSLNEEEEIKLSFDLSWGKEKLLVGVVGNIIKDFPVLKKWLIDAIGEREEEDVDNKDKTQKKDAKKEDKKLIGQIFDILPEICDKCPEQITAMTSILIDKETIWVDKNLNLEKIIQVIAPFLSLCLKKFMTIMLQAKKELKEKKKKKN